MLREFVGTINATGLCSLSQDIAACTEGTPLPNSVSFWAVLEEQSATEVIREVLAGRRQKALRLLEELAVSIGSQASS